jgi:hypothetical protein
MTADETLIALTLCHTCGQAMLGPEVVERLAALCTEAGMFQSACRGLRCEPCDAERRRDYLREARTALDFTLRWMRERGGMVTRSEAFAEPLAGRVPILRALGALARLNLAEYLPEDPKVKDGGESAWVLLIAKGNPLASLSDDEVNAAFRTPDGGARWGLAEIRKRTRERFGDSDAATTVERELAWKLWDLITGDRRSVTVSIVRRDLPKDRYSHETIERTLTKLVECDLWFGRLDQMRKRPVMEWWPCSFTEDSWGPGDSREEFAGAMLEQAREGGTP